MKPLTNWRVGALVTIIILLSCPPAARADFTVTLEPNLHDFGQVAVDDTSAPFNFIVTNIGDDSGHFTAEMSGLGEFSLVPNNYPVTLLGPGDSAAVPVIFRPTHPSLQLRVLVVRAAGLFYFATVYGSGVIPNTVNSHGEAATQLLLYVSPNPFNAAAVITYDIPMPTVGSLKIYDVLGREVATLVQGLLPAGHHQTVWLGTDAYSQALASGLYWARLECTLGMRVQKLVLCR